MFNPIAELKGIKHDREYLKDILEYGGKPTPLYVRKYKSLIKSGKKAKAEDLKRKQYIAIVKHNIKRAQKPHKDKNRDASRKHFLKEMEAELKSLESGKPRKEKESSREVSMYHATGDWVDKYKPGDTFVLKANKSKGPWAPLDKKAVYFSSNIEPNYAEGILQSKELFDEKRKLGVIKMKAKDRFKYNPIGEYEAAAKHDIKLKVKKKRSGAHNFKIGWDNKVNKDVVVVDAQPIGKVSFFSRAKKKLFSRKKWPNEDPEWQKNFLGKDEVILYRGEQDMEKTNWELARERRLAGIKGLNEDHKAMAEKENRNGRWFSDSLMGAMVYPLDKDGAHRVSTVRMPREEAEKYLVKNIKPKVIDYEYEKGKSLRILEDPRGRTWNGNTSQIEYFIPRDIVNSRKKLVLNSETGGSGQQEWDGMMVNNTSDHIGSAYFNENRYNHSRWAPFIGGVRKKKKVSVKPHKRQLGKKTVKVKGYKKIVHTKKKVKGK